MIGTVLLVLSTACLWLGSLAASVTFFHKIFGLRWRQALLLAYPLWWFAQLVITKALGLFEQINQPALLSATALLISLPVVFTVALKRRQTSAVSWVPPLERARTIIRSYWLEMLAVSYIGFVSLKAVLLYPSRIWDTYTYHLPIIANWLQQGSLRPWPTACLRQVTRPAGAEIQQLWVAGMSRADLLLEIPSLLAGVVVVVFVWEMVERWGASKGVAFCAGLSALAAPQVYWSALSSKDDLLLTAAILCCIYSALRACGDERQTFASAHAATAAIAAALVCGTKVPGLVFGSVLLALLAAVLLLRGMWKRLFLVSIVFAAAAIPAFVLQYLGNFLQYGALIAEAVGGAGSSSLERGRWLASSVSYIARLLFVKGTRDGVGPGHDQSNYGIWLALVVIPLLLMTNWGAITGRLRRARSFVISRLGTEKLFVAAYLLFALLVTATVHPISRWDQRFLVWIVPLILALGLYGAERYISPVCFRVLCIVFTLATVRGVLGEGYFAAMKGPGVGSVILWPEARYLPGYEALHDAAAGDTVLYVGGEDTAQSPCWGWRYDRTVWAADNAAAVPELFERSPRWVVLEEAAKDDLRTATLEALSTHGYHQVSQDSPASSHLLRHMRRSIWRK